MTKKLCKVCNKKKKAVDFYRDNLNKIDGLRYECKACTRAKVSRRYQLKSEEIKEYNRQYRKLHRDKLLKQKRMRSLGISSEEHDQIIARANGCCEICNKSREDFPYAKADLGTTSLSIDHNHTTGQFRGLLCAHCNHALGKLNDSGPLLIKALEYLALRDSSFPFEVKKTEASVIISPKEI
jgi:hypothetical protein